MAVYTTTIRTICEEINLHKPGRSTAQIIEYARPRIFDFSYPIFDPNYRAALETKILKHFYFREIGLETPGLFKFYLDERLNLEMPYYNKLYESVLLKFNPLHDIELRTERTGEQGSKETGNETGNRSRDVQNTATENREENASNTGTSENTSEAATRDFASDTPQGPLSQVDEGKYLSAYRKNTNDGSSRSEGTSTTTSEGESTTQTTGAETEENNVNRETIRDATDHYIEIVSGKSAGKNFSEMVLDFRASLLNVDKEVLKMLEPLFMQIY